MRAIWRQSPRPKLNITPAPSHEPVGGVLSRRTTTAPLRRRKAFRDAFTVFLLPVLATAFIADTNWKEKRKRDWDTKIAEIQAEIELLHARELQAWSSLQIRSAVFGAAHQRRSYSTAAAAIALPESRRDAAFQYDIPPDEPLSRTPTVFDEDKEVSCSKEEVQALKRFERLIAMKLAIQMILHVHIGNNSRFAGLPPQYCHEPNSLPNDINGLTDRLNAIRRNLGAMHFPSHALDSRQRLEHSPKRHELNRNLHQLASQYREGDMSVADTVEAFASQVLNSNETPTIATYTDFLRTFGRNEHEGLAYLIISAMGSTKLPLDEFALYNILLQFGKSKDTYHLDKFLKDLTQLNGNFKVIHKWEWWKIGGVRIPVPGDHSPRILQLLTFMALRSHQTDRAEAWASIIRDQEFDGKVKLEMLKNFLHYYTAHSDWERGKAWLKVASCSSSAVAAVSMHHLQRTIFRMLDLCVACGRPGEYSEILQTAIESGIPPEAPDTSRPVNLFVRGQRIVEEWAQLYQQSVNNLDVSNEQKALRFQELTSISKTFSNAANILRREDPHNLLTDVSLSNNGLAAQPPTTTEGMNGWKQLYEEQQAALVKLQLQLNQLRATHESSKATVADSSSMVHLNQSHLEKLRDEVNQSRAELASMQATKDLHDQALIQMRENMEQFQKELMEQTQGQRDQHQVELRRLRDEIEASQNMLKAEQEKEKAKAVGDNTEEVQVRMLKPFTSSPSVSKCRPLYLMRHQTESAPGSLPIRRFAKDYSPSHKHKRVQVASPFDEVEREPPVSTTPFARRPEHVTNKRFVQQRIYEPVPREYVDTVTTDPLRETKPQRLSASEAPTSAPIEATRSGRKTIAESDAGAQPPPQPDQSLIFGDFGFNPTLTSQYAKRSTESSTNRDDSSLHSASDDLIPKPSDLSDLTGLAPTSDSPEDFLPLPSSEPATRHIHANSRTRNHLPVLPRKLLQRHRQLSLRGAIHRPLTAAAVRGGESRSDWIHALLTSNSKNVDIYLDL